MSKILIIGGRFDLDIGANSICIRNIVNVLIRQNHQLWMITNSYEKDDFREMSNIKIYGVKGFIYETKIKPFQKKGLVGNILFHILSFIRHLLVMPFFPNVSYLRYRRILSLSKKLIKENDISQVICFYMPAESIYCGVRLKEIFKSKIKVISCHLDLLYEKTKDSFASLMPKYFISRIELFLKKEEKIVDTIVLPESECSKEKKSNKYKYAGFPVCVEYDDEKNTYDANLENNAINMIYIGSLDSVNRNPKTIIDFINRYNCDRKIKIILHIWGMIDEKISLLLRDNKNICYKGLLKNEYSLNVLKQSDFVLNIGNACQYNMVPSKIFKAFLSRKPIINLVKNNKDVSLKYFEEYGHVLNIFENKHLENEYSNFVNFICENQGAVFDVPQKLIECNTPEYYVSRMY